MKRKGLAWILGLALLATGCSGDTSGPPSGASFSPLFNTLYSNVRSSTKLIIRDAANWNELWDVIGAANADLRTPPRVDFNVDEVVVVALGERKRAGYQINIEQVVFTDSSRNIHVLTTAASEQCTSSEVITTPLDAAIVSKSAKPTRFVERMLIRGC